MFKTIVLFSDGTGNSSASPFKTNVFRLYEALDMSPEKGQIAYYDDGVGSSRQRFAAAIGGAFGFGLKRNVLDLYKFLTRHYADAIETLRDPVTGEIPDEKKDQIPRIACFGFSRGAFTIRVLIGLVATQGLPVKADSEAELDRLAQCAYRRLRAEHFKTLLHLEEPWRLLRDKVITPLLDKWLDRRPYNPDKNCHAERIDFLGLWDTVGAYGMPIEELRVLIDKFIFPLTFTSYNLLPIVKVTRHALSIDDERDAFTPIPFDDAPERAKAKEKRDAIVSALIAGGMDREEAENNAHENVCDCSQQIWFAGVHANVGGGYPDDSQAILPLRWIMQEAEKQGVDFLESRKADIIGKATAFGQLYDSRTSLNALYRYKPRDIAFILRDARQRTLIAEKRSAQEIASTPPVPALIHESVIYRMALRFNGYAPIALPRQFEVVDDTGRSRVFVDYTADAQAHEGRFAKASAESAPAKLSGLAELVAKLKTPERSALDLVADAVFWRRVSYYITIWALVALVAAPLVLERKEVDGEGACSELLILIVRSINGLLPDFVARLVAPWVDVFEQYPMVSGTLLAAFVLSLGWGARLRNVIADRSRYAWGMSERPAQSVFGRWLWDPLAQFILQSKTIPPAWNFLSNQALPWALVGFTFFLAFFALDRAYFHYRNYIGDICHETPGAVLLTGVETRAFHSSTPCAASGLKLEKGNVYLARFEIDDAWKDKDLEANLGGLKRDRLSLPMKAGLIFTGLAVKRVFAEPWFKPMLQVGYRGLDILPAEPAAPFPIGANKQKLEMRFKAPADGELFFFVNDVYAGLFPFALLVGEADANPDGAWRHTYGNNRGDARVTLRRLAPEEYGD